MATCLSHTSVLFSFMPSQNTDGPADKLERCASQDHWFLNGFLSTERWIRWCLQNSSVSVAQSLMPALHPTTTMSGCSHGKTLACILDNRLLHVKRNPPRISVWLSSN